MERLTNPEIDYSAVGVVDEMRTGTIAGMLCRLAAYEDTGLEPEEIKALQEGYDCQYQSLDFLLNSLKGVPNERLREIIKAEQEGRLVVLPCKVGDKIYILRGDVRNGYETVKKTHIEEVSFGLGCLNKQMKPYPFYFLTLAEAEAALKGVSDDA